MRAWLLRLRREGVRLGEDRPPGDWTEGFVTFTSRPTKARTFDCLVFRRVGDPHPMPDWCELFEPRIVAVGGGTLYVRGFERVGVAAVVQEWRLDCQRAVAPGEHYGPPLGEV